LDIRTDLSRVIDTTVPPILGTQNHICVIDPPGHPNVGDSAILLGELDFLRRMYPAAKVSFYDLNSYSSGADRFIDEASVLVLHGGGNFGDIWPHHHQFRHKILDRFRHKKIVQMPQSISFSDPAELTVTKRLIAAHPDFTFLIRDNKSLLFAAEAFECKSVLCPDMAFAMDPIVRKTPSVDVFGLLRTDKEVAADHDQVKHFLKQSGLLYQTADWRNDSNTLTRRIDHKLKGLTKRQPALTAPVRGLMLANRRRYAEQRVRYGVDLLSSGRIVVADRLHAHIMACLLDIPNLIFDSWDGKVSALYETWTAGRASTKLLQTPSQLPEHINAMMKSAAF
jgi:pyruvyl transferase EpsO